MSSLGDAVVTALLVVISKVMLCVISLNLLLAVTTLQPSSIVSGVSCASKLRHDYRTAMGGSSSGIWPNSKSVPDHSACCSAVSGGGAGAPNTFGGDAACAPNAVVVDVAGVGPPNALVVDGKAGAPNALPVLVAGAPNALTAIAAGAPKALPVVAAGAPNALPLAAAPPNTDGCPNADGCAGACAPKALPAVDGCPNADAGVAPNADGWPNALPVAAVAPNTLPVVAAGAPNALPVVIAGPPNALPDPAAAGAPNALAAGCANALGCPVGNADDADAAPSPRALVASTSFDTHTKACCASRTISAFFSANCRSSSCTRCTYAGTLFSARHL